MIDPRHLPDTTSRDSDWRDAGACGEHDPDLFFPTGTTGPALLQIEEAKAVCDRCPVIDECLQWALETGQDSGVSGGLSEDERRSMKRRAARNRRVASETKAARPERAPQPPKPETLQDIFVASTQRLTGGHLAWRGKAQTRFDGQIFTPKQVCFIVGRGRLPEGRVQADCGVGECVLPAHLSDMAERTRCGTRGGYRKHLAEGTEICRHCRRANSDADARLRRTGSTKALV